MRDWGSQSLAWTGWSLLVFFFFFGRLRYFKGATHLQGKRGIPSRKPDKMLGGEEGNLSLDEFFVRGIEREEQCSWPLHHTETGELWQDGPFDSSAYFTLLYLHDSFRSERNTFKAVIIFHAKWTVLCVGNSNTSLSTYRFYRATSCCSPIFQNRPQEGCIPHYTIGYCC